MSFLNNVKIPDKTPSGFLNKIQKGPVQQTPPPGPSSAMQNFPGTMKTLSELQTNPLSLGGSIKKAASSYVGGIKNAITSAGEALGKTLGLQGKQTPTQEVGNVLETTAKTAGAVLSPITSLFEAANEIPVAGTISRLAALPFSAVGEATSTAIGKGVDWALQPLAESKNPKLQEISKNIQTDIKPGLQEITALAAQLAAGKAIDLGVKELELSKRFGATDAKTIVTKAQEISGKTPETPKTSFLQQVQTKEGTPEAPQTLKTAPESTIAPKTDITAPQTQPALPETKPTKVATDINKILEQKSIEGLSPEQQAQYNSGSYKDSVPKVIELRKTNPEALKTMAKTGEGIPNDIYPQILFNEVKNEAVKNLTPENVQLLKDLSQSPLATVRSEAAATLGSAGFNNGEIDPVKAISDLSKLKAKARGLDVSKAEAVDEGLFKSEIKKSLSTRESWAEFAKKISCNY